MSWITEPQAWVALLTLTALEIVLGIDNIVFISILSSRLPAHRQNAARTLGLGMALFGRVALLLSLTWILGLVEPLFRVLGQDVSGRDIILLLGGLFLLGKATHEIHAELEGSDHERTAGGSASFGPVLAQILVLDLVFSLDSVITAVGMAQQIGVMVTAVVIAVLFMMASAKLVSEFIHRHPTVKVLALAFLLMVGVALIADALDVHIPRGYVYFSMGFSVLVEAINLRVRARKKKVEAASS